MKTSFMAKFQMTKIFDVILNRAPDKLGIEDNSEIIFLISQ